MGQPIIRKLRDADVISHPREKRDDMWWLADGSARFLSFHEDEVQLWQSRRPNYTNVRLAGLPVGRATVETVKTLIEGN